jgi:hypothetical protein
VSGENKQGWKDRIATGAKVAQEKLAEAKAKSEAKPKEYRFAGVFLENADPNCPC